MLVSISSNEVFLLLSLGMTMSRYRYLGRYLAYLKQNNIDLQSIGFFKNISNNPLSDSEKDELAKYIIESHDFEVRLFTLAGERNTEKLLDALVDYIAVNGVDEITLKILTDNEIYLELLQEDIYETLKKEPYKNMVLANYLDFSIIGHQILLEQYGDLFLIHSILLRNVFRDRVFYADNFNIRVSLQIIRKQQIEEVDWVCLKEMVIKEIKDIGNIDEHVNILNFILALTYMDKIFVENILVEIYKMSKLYSNIALMKLASIQSQYAYREMLSFMLTSEDRKERYKYAVKLMMAYPHNGSSIYSYAMELNDERLIQTLNDVAKKFNIQTEISEKYKEIFEVKDEKIQLIPKGTIISELLFDLAKDIKANTFYMAVGFTFSSGLRLLYPLINYIYDAGGTIELITGSLQSFENEGRNNKIDKGTVIFLNKLIDEINLNLFTYTDTFYHGKFYYLANDEKAYILIGSSNISKTAFLGNYELDTLITVDLKNEKNQFLYWYEEFRQQCKMISHLDDTKYENFKWESELDIYSSKYVHRLSNAEVKQKINELTDEDTRFRLNSWINHNPSEIYSNLGILSLQDYIVFLYAERGLAVFESFIPNNAYYTFKYFDFDELLKNVSSLTKTQMVLSSDFVGRGYHISDRDRLETKIHRLFG